MICSNAIRQVDAHVEQKPQTDYAGLGNSSHNHIQKNGGIGMQRVKINAATVGIVNGAGQQVVKIDNHGQYHDKPHLLPSMLEKKNRYQSRNQNVKGNVKSGVNHTFEYTGQKIVRVLVVNSLRFMKKLFYHESTKRRKHENKEKFRAFQFSCFRD